jgi:hypothetical protein
VVAMKSTIFWDITPCSLVGVYRRSVGTYCLHLEDRRVSQESNQQEASSMAEDGGSILLRNAGVSTGLHGVTSNDTIVVE